MKSYLLVHLNGNVILHFYFDGRSGIFRAESVVLTSLFICICAFLFAFHLLFKFEYGQ